MPVLKRYTGTDWEVVGSPSQRVGTTLGYASRSVNVLSVGTTPTVVTGLSLAVTVPEGRRLRISGYVPSITKASGAPTWVQLRIRRNGTEVQRALESINNDTFTTLPIGVVETPPGGTHTYDLTMHTDTGTIHMDLGSAGPNTHAYILVEDITGDPLPYEPQSVPVGLLGYAELIADQSGISTNALLGALSVNVAVPAGRTLRINTYFDVLSTVDGAVPLVEILQDGAVIARSTLELGDATNRSFTMVGSVLESPPAGAHTYAVRLVNALGGGSLTATGAANRPGYISVEDITPSPAPSTGAPGSTLGYAEYTAGASATFTTLTDLTGLTVTVTVPAGRRLRISGKVLGTSSAAGDRVDLLIREGSTQLQDSTRYIQVNNGLEEISVDRVVTPTAGTHTYKLSMNRPVGSGNAFFTGTPDYPAFILVEDITGSVWPEGSAVTAGMIASEAWTPWTPTWAGWTVGNGVVVARYQKVGRTVKFRLSFTLGSTSGAPSDPNFSLPVPAASDYIVSAAQGESIGISRFVDAGTADYSGHVFLGTASNARPLVSNAASSYLSFAALNGTTPMTWVAGDKLVAFGRYEAAS